MGFHHSKGFHHSATSSLSSSSNPSTSIVRASPVSSTRTIYFGWEEIYRGSHAEWLEHVSEQFGFTNHAFTCNSELHSICAPGFCSETLSRKLHPNLARCSTRKRRSLFSSTRHSTSTSLTSSKSKKLREHFEYNHIPAMISSLQNYSVHGIVNGSSISDRYNGDTIMLSIYSTSLDRTKFIIVDLKLNRYVCTLENDYHGLIDARKVHSAWSMDRSQVILRIPLANGMAALDFYKVVKKDAKLYRHIAPVDPLTQFQFNPNYWSSRLVLYSSMSIAETTLTNYYITSLTPGGSNKVQTQSIHLSESSNGSSINVKLIQSWSTCQSQSIHINENFRLLSIFYTFDSIYLMLTFADINCHCGSTLPLSYFDLYHSQTLQCLHRFHTQLLSHTCPLHMCRNILTPILSVSASKMAFSTTKNNGGKELQVSIVVLPTELNLKFICRRLIREYFYQSNGKIEEIFSQLPYRLSQYIQYRPEYQ